MIIHSYLTNGFFPWAKIFLESYKFHNGEENRIILSTRDLTNHQIIHLNSIYSNLEIRNQFFNINKLAEKAGVTSQRLLSFKKEVEEVHVTQKNKVWKLMIAADDRVKSILEVVKDYQDEDYMFHTDIDMYVRAPLTELFKFIMNHDISIKLRLKSKLNRKTMIGIQGYRLCNQIIKFLETWIKYVDDIEPKNRPLGYGQTSCFYAYEIFKNQLKWGSIPRRYIAPQMFDRDVIWSANTKEGKTKNLEICYADFKEIKNGTKINNTF